MSSPTSYLEMLKTLLIDEYVFITMGGIFYILLLQEQFYMNIILKLSERVRANLEHPGLEI